jgi:uncharacterized protein (TIGR02099 family)
MSATVGRRLGIAAAMILGVAAVLMVMLLAALRFWLWPELDLWREALVRELSVRSGMEVSVGRLEGQWNGWWPEAVASDVQVHADGAEASLPLVRVTLGGGWAAWRAGKGVVQILVPAAQVRVDDAAVFVQGLRSGGAAPSAGLPAGVSVEVGEARLVWRREGREALARGSLALAMGVWGWQAGFEGEAPDAVRHAAVLLSGSRLGRVEAQFDLKEIGGEALALWWPQAAGLRPEGSVSGAVVLRDGRLHSLDLALEKAGWAAEGESFGVRGVSGRIAGDRAGGELALSIAQGAMSWPAVWPQLETVAVPEGVIQGRWAYDGNGYDLTFEEGRLRTEDFTAQLSGHYRLARTGDVADLQGSLDEVVLDRLVRYLPGRAVGPHVQEWLHDALVAGKLSAVEFRLRGPLADFPFRDDGGEFWLRLPLEGVTLRFAPQWPEFEQVKGVVTFDRGAVAIEVAQAQAQGVRFGPIRAFIPEFDAEIPVLTVTGEAEGPWSAFLRYAAASPLREDLPLAALQAVQLEAKTALRLGLTMPLAGDLPEGVSGTLTFSEGRIPAQVAGWPIEQIRGEVAFDGHGVRSAQAEGKWWDAPVTAKWQGGDPPKLALQGSFSAAQLSAVFGKLPLSGSTAVSGTLTFAKDAPALVLASDLTGMGSDLPPPLDKPAGARWPSRAELKFWPSGMEAKAQLGERLRFVRARDGAWAAAVGGGGAPTPRRGGMLQLAASELDLDRWLGLTSGIGEGAEASALAALQVDAATARFLGRSWHRVHVQGESKGPVWSLAVATDEAQGNVRVTLGKAGAERVEGRFAKLMMPEAEAGGQAPQEGRLPAFDLTVDRFGLGDRWLGALALRASLAPGQWLLDALTLEVPAVFRIDASGVWRDGERPQTELATKMTIEDAGKTVRHWFDTAGLERGRGQVTAQWRWPGSPLDFDLYTVAGRGEIEITNGRFEEIEPGVGRLLGILSLQSLPRRLLLDFGDVFAKGMAFDRLQGSFALNDGYLTTSDLRIAAPSATVEMVGLVDLRKQTQELDVTVRPRLSDSTAVAVGIANPIAGAVAFIGQKLLGDPFGRILGRRFHVTGPWSEPEVKPLEPVPVEGEGGK